MKNYADTIWGTRWSVLPVCQHLLHAIDIRFFTSLRPVRNVDSIIFWAM